MTNQIHKRDLLLLLVMFNKVFRDRSLDVLFHVSVICNCLLYRTVLYIRIASPKERQDSKRGRMLLLWIAHMWSSPALMSIVAFDLPIRQTVQPRV
jgi:hypothetical protein